MFRAKFLRFRDLPWPNENGGKLNDKINKKVDNSLQPHLIQTYILRAIKSNDRCRIVLPEELDTIAETDLWECWQKISRYRYRFSIEFQVVSIADRRCHLGLEIINSEIILVTAACWCRSGRNLVAHIRVNGVNIFA